MYKLPSKGFWESLLQLWTLEALSSVPSKQRVNVEFVVERLFWRENRANKKPNKPL